MSDHRETRSSRICTLATAGAWIGLTAGAFPAVMLVTLLGVREAAAQAAIPAARQLGTVKAINGSTVTLTTSAGATVAVTLAPAATILQLPPGSTDLKSATPTSVEEISVGDRILASGQAGSDGLITASRVILMKSSAIAARNSAQQADWQKRGVSGLVKSINGDEVTMSVGPRTVMVVTTPQTLFRRYAADSVSFTDAKPGTLAQIQPGDQMTVRGAHSDDNSKVTAEEVVSGSFANLSGVLTAVNPTAGTVSLKDLATKRSVTVAVTANSDLRKLPAQAAAMFAARSGGGAAGGGDEHAARPGEGSGGSGNGGGQTGRSRAGMDLSRMLPRLPSETLAELKPGEAVMIVASEGRNSDAYTAITLLTGVEQLLSATAANSQPITLSPWNLSVPEGGGAQ